LDNHKVTKKHTRWAGHTIDPNNPLQPGHPKKGGADQARVRVDGSDHSVNFGSPVPNAVIVPLNRTANGGGGDR
jgi:hypothetical protein